MKTTVEAQGPVDVNVRQDSTIDQLVMMGHADLAIYASNLQKECALLKVVGDYDMSKVVHLTHRKARDIIARNGYALTGFVLTDTDGRKCIVDMSAVRWFDKPEDFFRLMHTDALPPN